MRYLPKLFENNRRWVAEKTSVDPDFFARQQNSQEPPFLWIGCADSRVPANEIVGLEPGQLFVHRNVANIVAEDDGNLQAALQYAVDNLKVRHVIVCGHYGCGGVQAAMGDPVEPPLEDWIDHIRRIYRDRQAQLDAIEDMDARWRKLCEVNVAEQVANVCASRIVSDAWRRGQQVVIHGWIYDLGSGLLEDLDLTTDGLRAEPGSTDDGVATSSTRDSP
ncbi:MAG: carbonic anhydrase [Rhodothermia bacterium]|nr:carbonic anhydrase [Rhodothermia bacterium]